MKMLAVSVAFTMSLLSGATGQDSALRVCELVKSGKQYDGKTVVVTGFVMADRHSTLITGEECASGIVIRYPIESMPQGFVDGVEDKRLKLDARPFRITVRAKFSLRVRAPLGYISRLEVARVLNWEFIGEKDQAPPPIGTVVPKGQSQN